METIIPGLVKAMEASRISLVYGTLDYVCSDVMSFGDFIDRELSLSYYYC